MFKLKNYWFLVVVWSFAQECIVAAGGPITAEDRDRAVVFGSLAGFPPATLAKGVNILSIDGGGVRGIVPAVVLELFEQDTGLQVSQAFDLIAGTSVGGLLTLGLTCPRVATGQIPSAHDLVNEWSQLVADVFQSRSVWSKIVTVGGFFGHYQHNPSHLNDKLTTWWGPDAKLFPTPALPHIVTPRVPVIITSVDARLNVLKTFRNYRAAWDARQNFSLQNVGRATSAAPTYFPIAETNSLVPAPILPEHYLIDGGMAANNPSLLALTEAWDLYGYNTPVNIVRLGCGTETSNGNKPFDMAWCMRAESVIDTLFSTQSDSTSQILSSIGIARKMHGAGKVKVFDLQISFPPDRMIMNNAEAANIQSLIALTRQYWQHGGGLQQYTEMHQSVVGTYNNRP